MTETSPGLARARHFRDFEGCLPHQPSSVPPAPRWVRDQVYENSPGVHEALVAIDSNAPAVLITGRAGTGKTTLIKYLQGRPGGERQVVVAPTAVAALNAGAQTIHSLFQFPHLVLDPQDLPGGYNFGALFHRMDRLILDEVSMTRVDLVDAMDARLRAIRKDPRPFGGVQFVMVGDFLQLPPVVPEEDRPVLHGLGYKSPFAFSSRALSEVPITTISLEQVHRQDERCFVDLLNRVRLGQDQTATVDALNSRCLGPHRSTATPLLLTPTRSAADAYNRIGLSALPGPSVIKHAEITGKLDIGKDRLPVPERLELRVGARVMTAKNDFQRRWINGSLGTVTSFHPNGVVVQFDRTGEQHVVTVEAWEKVRQVWDPTTQSIKNETVARYAQIPLAPAWAITIHKAQGLTLEDVRIDFGQGAFAPGQAYVALSRVRTIAGLSFARPLREGDLKVDPILLEFVRWADGLDRVA